jgi:predicted small secreted protein
MKMKKTILMITILASMIVVGCGQNTKANYDSDVETNNFKKTRRLVVVNELDSKILVQIVGNFTVSQATNQSDLEVLCEVKKDVYKKHIVHINDNNFYVIEDITGAKDKASDYEVIYSPRRIVSYKLK